MHSVPGGGSTHSPYALEGGHKTSTFLVLQRGASKRDWPMTLVSNHRLASPYLSSSCWMWSAASLSRYLHVEGISIVKLVTSCFC